MRPDKESHLLTITGIGRAAVRMGLALLCATSMGCVANRLPRKLTTGEHNIVSSADIPFVVAVENASPNASRLIQILSSAALFTDVLPASQAAEPDLIAEEEPPLSDDPSPQKWPWHTLGIIPSVESAGGGQLVTEIVACQSATANSQPRDVVCFVVLMIYSASIPTT